MAVICPRCKSPETQALISNNQCLSCRGLFGFNGELEEPGLSASTRAAIEASLAPRVTVYAGNLADLMRAGSEVAVHGSGSLADGVRVATGGAPHEAITIAEDDARQGIGSAAQGDALTTSGSVQTKGKSTKKG